MIVDKINNKRNTDGIFLQKKILFFDFIVYICEIYENTEFHSRF